jgi:ParB-like chromosome segregation protein Spo0J
MGSSNVAVERRGVRAHAAPKSPASVRLADLRTGCYAREGGLDAAHVAALAEVPEAWPPIVVAREDYSVVDGHHRVAAANDLGLRRVRAVFFDGTPEEAYAEFVRRNVAHGLPLSLAERRRAARRMLGVDASRSDRSIAADCALSPKTVGKLRSELASAPPRGTEAAVTRRTGRDGRRRPVDAAALRARIARELEQEPTAPLREIARRVRASPETVRSVKRRMIEPTPTDHSPREATVLGLPTDRGRRRLAEDPAFASRADAEIFATLFDATTVDRASLIGHVESVPLSRIYEVADEARRRAELWREFADVLESRVHQRRRA